MDHLTTGAMRRPEKEVKETLVVPRPAVEARELPRSEVDNPRFPRAVRSAWKAALAIPDTRMVEVTYSVGPWMSARFDEILEPNCQTLMLWVLRAEGERLRALWINRDGWSFQDAWISHPSRRANSKEMKAWLTAHTAA